VRPFNLLRYFAFASLAVIALLALATAAIFSRNLQRNLTEEAGLYAADISATLERAIFFEYLLPRTRAGLAVDLEDPAQRALLDAVVARATRGLRILTVNLFRTDGTIEYSTKPEYIGYRSIDNPGIERALATGQTASFLKRAELEADPIRPGHDLLESYTPFHELDPESLARGSVIGVIELYQDARPITAKIAQGRRQILASTAGLMSVLFIALFAVVRLGHQRIGQLTAALEGTNRELEQRVRERTREIEAARRRLRGLFDAISDGISVIDQLFRVSEANSGAARLFGARGLDDPAPCYLRYAGRSTPCTGCPARRALEHGRPATQRYRWPAGPGEIEVEVTAFPFQGELGEPAVIEVVRDVSERAELERQIAQSASLASLGELAAGVAHEIRNPVGVIASAAQLLGQGQHAERDRPLVDAISAEAARIGRTIQEFVGFAAPFEPSRNATEPAALLARVRDMLRPEAERRGLELRVIASPEGAHVPKILVDPELLYRALANLVLNALQVQERGGWVELEARRASGDEVSIHVRDGGPGIEPADLGRIFQPFFTRRREGTGLGLSIVQRIVTANGGRIAVQSDANGTEFTLYFAEAGA
jgi:signal transduction histidine kinase